MLLAGGLPLEFPTIALGENLMKPTAMLDRNLMSMDVEESIRSYPLDAVVLLGGCDTTVPAQLMGAASAGVPAIMVVGGPSEPAWFRGRQLGAGTDLWHYADELRAGRMSGDEFAELEDGDPIALDVDAGRHDADVPPAELGARLERLGQVAPPYRRGHGAMYLEHVLQADEGCDFDFLRARGDEAEGTEPLGLLSGWVGGW